MQKALQKKKLKKLQLLKSRLIGFEKFYDNTKTINWYKKPLGIKLKGLETNSVLRETGYAEIEVKNIDENTKKLIDKLVDTAKIKEYNDIGATEIGVITV